MSRIKDIVFNMGDTSLKYSGDISFWFLACPYDKKAIDIEGMDGEESSSKLLSVYNHLYYADEKGVDLKGIDDFLELLHKLIETGKKYTDLEWSISSKSKQ